MSNRYRKNTKLIRWNDCRIRCMGRGVVAIVVLAITATSSAAGMFDPLLPIWAEIRTEASRANNDPVGRPLPLAATWQAGEIAGMPLCNPDYLMGQIDTGHYLIPSFAFPWIGATMDSLTCKYYGGSYRNYFTTSLGGAQNRGLPLLFLGTQWEQAMETQYLYRPMSSNPNVFDPSTGGVRIVSSHGFLDPMGPVLPWQEIGTAWTTSPIWSNLQGLYPSPPQVFLMSNNEANKLTWSSTANSNAYPNISKRYVDAYGLSTTNEFKRQVVGEGWITRYRAMQASMQTGLNGSGTWGSMARFIGYDAFGPSHFRAWYGWGDYSLALNQRIDPSPLTWDGGSPSYYNSAVKSDYQVDSMQVRCQNWVFMLDEALRLNPNFWFEMSIWDGNNNGGANYGVPAFLNAGQTYPPNRYKGWIQYGMWITRPRSVREFRGWQERLDCNGPDNGTMPYTNTGYTNEQYFLALCAAVDRVHTSPTLRSFWRKGILVQNTAEAHPYQDGAFVPVGYDDATINAGTGRWFLLTCSANPPRSSWASDFSTTLYVYALALVQGTAPNRQWLVYAHAPLGNKSNVGITLPGYGSLTLNVPQAGQFWKVDEASRTLAVVNDTSTAPGSNVMGKLSLGNFSGDNSTVSVTVELRASGTYRDNVTLDTMGNFKFPQVVPAGTYTAWIKASHWLAKTVSGVTVRANDAADLGTINLINGDCDGNNIVDASDLSILLVELDSKSGDLTWNPNGDLDGDGEITTSDLSILLTNVDQAGDG